MKSSKIRNIGNSNGLILPAEALERAGLYPGADVEITFDPNNNIVLSKISSVRQTSEIIDTVYGMMKDHDEIGNEEIAKTIMTCIQEAVAEETEDYLGNVINIFQAYKNGDVDKLFEAMTGGYQLRDVLEMTVLKEKSECN